MRRFKSLWMLFCIGIMLVAGVAEAPAQKAAKAKQRILQFKKMKLIETLDMDDQTAEKFFVLYNAKQKKVEEAKQRLDSALRVMRSTLRSGASDKEIEEKSLEALSLHDAMLSAHRDMLESAKNVLNARQYATFLIFETTFHDEIRKILQDMRRNDGRGGPPRRRP